LEDFQVVNEFNQRHLLIFVDVFVLFHANITEELLVASVDQAYLLDVLIVLRTEYTEIAGVH